MKKAMTPRGARHVFGLVVFGKLETSLRSEVGGGAGGGGHHGAGGARRRMNWRAGPPGRAIKQGEGSLKCSRSTYVKSDYFFVNYPTMAAPSLLLIVASEGPHSLLKVRDSTLEQIRTARPWPPSSSSPNAFPNALVGGHGLNDRACFGLAPGRRLRYRTRASPSAHPATLRPGRVDRRHSLLTRATPTAVCPPLTQRALGGVAGLDYRRPSDSRASSPPDSPCLSCRLLLPAVTLSPGRVDQRHSLLLTSRATPTTVRPTPSPTRSWGVKG